MERLAFVLSSRSAVSVVSTDFVYGHQHSQVDCEHHLILPRHFPARTPTAPCRRPPSSPLPRTQSTPQQGQAAMPWFPHRTCAPSRRRQRARTTLFRSLLRRTRTYSGLSETVSRDHLNASAETPPQMMIKLMSKYAGSKNNTRVVGRRAYITRVLPLIRKLERGGHNGLCGNGRPHMQGLSEQSQALLFPGLDGGSSTHAARQRDSKTGLQNNTSIQVLRARLRAHDCTECERAERRHNHSL